jgi:uncharacterized protein involved in outer membrane biogenesis
MPISPRARRRALIALGVLVLLAGAYAALGYLLVPSLVRKQLVERAAEAGLDLRLARLRANPFALVVNADQLELSARDGTRLAEARHVSVDLAWSSLWRRTFIVEHLTLEAPVLHALPPVPMRGRSDGGAPPDLVVRSLDVHDGRVALPQAPGLEHLELQARDLAVLQGHDNTFNASAALAGGGTVRTQGTLVLSPFKVAGKLEVADAALAEAWRYLPRPAGPAPRGTIGGSLGYRYADGRTSISDASAQARLASGATLRASGALTAPEVSGELRLVANAVPLSLAEPWMSGLHIAAGTLSADGKLRLGKPWRYEGSAALRDVRLEGPQGELLAWQSLASSDLGVQFSPFAARAGEVLAQAPRVQVAIDRQGRLNLAQAFSRPQSSAPHGGAPEIAVARLRIENGELGFADRSLATPFSTTVRELGGALTEIHTGGGEPARVQLAGRVGRYGDARVRGSIDLTAPSSRTNVNLRFRNLALRDFTPYVAKFAGYRVESGRLTANLTYRVRDGRLVGKNQLVFDELQLGEKVASASALDVPLDLAVALLTDAQGRINLAIPVTGDLRDPHVDLGGLIAKALRNTLARIVSAPFRMLASLLGKAGADAQALREVRFEPGSARLAPPEEQGIARLAKALAARPRLALAVRGGIDPQADRGALARAEVLRELAKRAGYSAAAGGSAPSGIDPRDTRIQHAAERLLLDRGGRTSELAPLKPREPGYGRRLVDFLAAREPLAPDALASLAGERAAAVRKALLEHGVDAGRIAIGEPAETEASDAGVPTPVALRSARGG